MRKGKSKLIDPSARIDPSAKLGTGVSIGPWTIIGPGVSIGDGTVIESHVVMRANCRIGKNNRIFQFSTIGEDPADKKFHGEEAWLEIGDNNIIREGSNLQRGTATGGGVTRIGSNNLLMPYVHIAHDCSVGNDTVFANNASLSGHVEVSDWAILGGYAGVNQFLKVGAHSMVGGMTHIDHDVPAFVIVSGHPASVRTINTIGLERRGFSKEAITALRSAFKIIYKRHLKVTEAIETIKELRQQAIANEETAEVLQCLIDSLESSQKGIHR